MNAASAHVRRTTSAPSLPAVAAASSSSHGRRQDLLGNVPHTAGSGECLCSSCHLKVYFFPRRQDGRIVLPPPSMTQRNQRLGGPPNARAREKQEVPIQQPVQNLQVDLGEGTSNPSGQLSGPGVPASHPQVIALRPFFDFPDDTGKPKAEINVISNHAKTERRPRSNTKSYPHRTSNKPYQRTRPGPASSNVSGNEIRPRSRSVGLANIGVVGFLGSHEHSTSAGVDSQFPNPYAEINSHPTSSRAGGRLSWPDPYATIIEEPFSQLFNAPIGLGKRELNLSGSSTALSHQTSFSGESEQKVSPSMLPALPQATMMSRSTRSPSVSQPRYYGTATVSQNEAGVTPSNLPRDLAMVSIENPPRVIRFNSRHNPQPAMWVSRADVDLDEDRSQARVSPPHPQTHSGMLQFQNPLIPESYPAIVTESTTREISVINAIKWDSERKRRQGYFAQEQGVEKSPFRHYNKDEL